MWKLLTFLLRLFAVDSWTTEQLETYKKHPSRKATPSTSFKNLEQVLIYGVWSSFESKIRLSLNTTLKEYGYLVYVDARNMVHASYVHTKICIRKGSIRERKCMIAALCTTGSTVTMNCRQNHRIRLRHEKQKSSRHKINVIVMRIWWMKTVWR